jgi:hypothetical protein
VLRTKITIDHSEFHLAQGQDVRALQRDIERAARDGGGFVRFVEVGNHEVATLITPGVGVIVESHEVAYDGRDTGDLRHPFSAPDDASRRQFHADWEFDV